MYVNEVRNIMKPDPVTVKPTDTIDQITNIMIENRLQQLPVVEGKMLVGLITSYDLWRDLSTDPKSGQKKVAEVMTKNVLIISPKDKVATAAELFMDKRFKTLPVANLKGELKGVITAFDIIKFSFLKENPNPILYKE